jgi:hypothetical protein
VLCGSYKGWVVVDEVSLLSISVLNYLQMLTKSDCKFIMLGDFFQLPPVADIYASKQVLDNGFANSRLLHILADGNVLHMRRCKRSSDHLFSFVMSLYPGASLSHLELAEQVRLAKLMFPSKPGLARWNLVISHTKRKMINRICYNAMAGNSPRLQVSMTQDLMDEVFVGCPLVGSQTNRKGVVNGAFYAVQGWSTKHVFIKDLESDEALQVPMESMKHLRIGFSLTYASVQGRTLREHTRLWDTSHGHFSSKHLAMGLSRCVAGILLDLA